MAYANVRVSELLATITISVTMPPAFGPRMWLAGLLIRTAARLIGCGVAINIKGDRP